MPIYLDGNIIVAETGGEGYGYTSYEYSRYFSELYKKTGKCFKTKKLVQLVNGTHIELEII